ncbi:MULTISPECIES: hypothetical protein [Pseudomonas]|uniref:hypothetical protein n=1 Tax=Pseudomonas TaxID=286 RepID=UPI0018E797B4|nr:MULTISPECIES: hypothetical protein [Pseudomonas]MBJ2204600.1 hypothetical protein [Pseudomonas carnis]MBJ2303164.1 hypothetical protein [Pseudomonas sp. MF2846]MBK3488277.1 hypothetical protein [Pseudomonas sp. MF2857]
MHPKNSNKAEITQEVSALPLAIVPTEKRHDVAAMLIAERKHATTWWTILNEMRQRRELPEWALKMSAGSHPSWDVWDVDCRVTNMALLAFDGHLSFAEGALSSQGGAQ